ncbi:Hpt domain-containing protein [uncultured Acetobacteroides sp.]|uniref:Hpt domain-containing protein n=1 Tax=uncultured Acetobacteroides sp. TaxID=1760811 RepID=UPI0029F55DFF|nr:Hpt domain-containing protein [uncultured Acetobacteroides sp.]
MLYDLSDLHRYSKGDSGFEGDLLQAFLDQASAFISQVNGLTACSRLAEVGRAAHKFRSSISFFGMEAIRAELELLEGCCNEDGRQEHALKLYFSVKAQLQQVIPKIEKERRRCRQAQSRGLLPLSNSKNG